MKKILFLYALLFLITISCDNEERLLRDQQIQFEFVDVPPAEKSPSGGRSAGLDDPKGVLVSIQDLNGNTIAEKKELTLYKFGDHFLSSPLTLDVANGNYLLTEFFVIAEDKSILLATPKAGSALARMVTHPLDIEFSIEKDKITTVSPEVIKVDTNSLAKDFGYGQFGFQTIKTVSVIFSSFIKGVSNFELTTSDLKIQGLNDTTSTDSTALWTYDTELDARANTLVLKEAKYYRVIATKEGYTPWKRNLKLSNGSKTEILFDSNNHSSDIYISGAEILNMKRFATYWKNGQPVKLSTLNSYANHVYVSGEDVYVTGSETGTKNAFYWKNGEKVIIPFSNSDNDFADKILVNGNDVHIIGSSFPKYTVPAYWKNGARVPLNGSGNFTRTDASAIAIDGNDVYVIGTEGILGTTNDLPSYPRIWKNSVLAELPLPSADYTRTFVHSIIIKNGHIYICGTTRAPGTSEYKVILWKDNIPTILKSPYLSSTAHAMHIEDDGTVHIVGGGSDMGSTFHPLYWKNGVPTTVEHQDDYLGKYYSVTTSGSNVVIAGTYNKRAVYWKDGVRVSLLDSESAASSMFHAK